MKIIRPNYVTIEEMPCDSVTEKKFKASLPVNGERTDYEFSILFKSPTPAFGDDTLILAELGKTLLKIYTRS